MQPLTWARLVSDWRRTGLQLAILNLILASFCVLTFFAVLAATLVLSGWLQSYTGNSRISVPFPVPVLFLLYVLVFVLVWVRFARGLPAGPRSHAFETGLLGAAPLLGLCLLGYLGAAWVLATGDFGPGSMLEASVVIYSILSTLVLLAGVTCTVVIALFSPRPRS